MYKQGYPTWNEIGGGYDKTSLFLAQLFCEEEFLVEDSGDFDPACVSQRNHTCGHVSFFNILFCVYLDIQYIWHSEQDFWDKNQALINPNVSLGAMYHVVTLHVVLLFTFSLQKILF